MHLAVPVAVLAAVVATVAPGAARPARPHATPTGTPSASPAASPASAAPQPAGSPAGTDAPTPIPTQPPTPRPIAPYQPTIPQAATDPNVQSIRQRPIRELSQIGWLAGTWRAHNVQELGTGGSRDLGLNTYVFAPTMHERWMFGADGKSADSFYITFDPFSRHWILVRLESNPAYGIWVSERGWQGNAIAFTSNFSYANGRQYRRRITLIHKDARTAGLYDEEQLSDGSWTADDAVELKRQ